MENAQSAQASGRRVERLSLNESSHRLKSFLIIDKMPEKDTTDADDKHRANQSFLFTRQLPLRALTTRKGRWKVSMMYRDESVGHLDAAARCTLRSSVIDICFVIAHHAKLSQAKYMKITKHGAIIILIRYQATFSHSIK